MTTPMIYFLVGFIIATTLVFLLGRFSRCKKKAEFDERQLKVRGDAFKYGFFTILIGLAIQIVVIATDEAGADIYYTSAVLIFAAGLTVYAVYAVWNDGFIGIKTNKKTTIILDAIIALVNLFAGINSLHLSHMPENYNGFIPGFTNLTLAAVFAIILVTLLIKKIVDKDED